MEDDFSNCFFWEWRKSDSGHLMQHCIIWWVEFVLPKNPQCRLIIIIIIINFYSTRSMEVHLLLFYIYILIHRSCTSEIGAWLMPVDGQLSTHSWSAVSSATAEPKNRMWWKLAVHISTSPPQLEHGGPFYWLIGTLCLGHESVITDCLHLGMRGYRNQRLRPAKVRCLESCASFDQSGTMVRSVNWTEATVVYWKRSKHKDWVCSHKPNQ